MHIHLIDDKSPFLNDVIILGDQNSATLGFMPEQAFRDYAHKEQIIVAIDDKTLLGYLMFRISKYVTSIVHLCISNEQRGAGIAKALMQHLFDLTTHTYGIKLLCRRDYALDGFWRSLGFTPVSEKSGRAKKAPTILTVWYRTHYHETLFDYTEKVIGSKPFIAVLDTNIVIDLFEASSIESLQLKAPYLRDAVTFKVTDTIFHEINTQRNENLRIGTREFAKQFDVINNANLAEYQLLIDDISGKFENSISDNTVQDISHIAHAITSGALSFITRDHAWLNSEIANYINNQYGLRILSPGEFILSIDELSRQEDYLPLKLAGLKLQYSKMSATDLRSITPDLQHTDSSESLKDLQQKIRLLMADPKSNDIFVIKSDTAIVAVIAYTKIDKHIDIKLFRTSLNALSPSLYPTLLKRLAMKLLEISTNAKAELITLDRSIGISESAEEAFRSAGYNVSSTKIFKVILDESLNIQDFVTRYNDICILYSINDNPNSFSIAKDVRLLPQDIIFIEKSFWPLKIQGVLIPTYIVPIKPSYAKELFDEDLVNSNPSLFSNERIEPALSIENVYFKSPFQTPKMFPARILWYVSNEKNTMYSSSIRACSYLDNIEIDFAKKLYERYRRLGVLEWSNIMAIAKGNPNGYISCYKFSYTEIFHHVIPYDELQKWYKGINKKNLSVQSYTEIDNSLFASLYFYGKHGYFPE